MTDDSFKRRFDDWRETDFAAFAAAHPDNVRQHPSNLRFDELMPILKPLVVEPALKVSFGASGESPLVHRLLVGDAKRKLLYFANYVGCAQNVTFELPSDCADWKLTTLVGSVDGNRTALAGSYGVAAAMPKDAALAARWQAFLISSLCGVARAISQAFHEVSRKR